MKVQLKKLLKKLYHNSKFIHRILLPVKKIELLILTRFFPEHVYRKYQFKKIFGYRLNIYNPKTLHEKINWIQLNDITPLHTLCADKYAVRNYVEEKIGKQYLIPLVFHTKDPNKIIPENLPNYPIIIKTNHGCGGHIIIKNKSEIIWKVVQKI